MLEKMLEKIIERHLKSRLRKLGIGVRKARWIGSRGCPDLFIFAKGGVWVECKAPGETPRLEQLNEHHQMQRGGVDVRVIDSIEAANALIAEIS